VSDAGKVSPSALLTNTSSYIAGFLSVSLPLWDSALWSREVWSVAATYQAVWCHTPKDNSMKAIGLLLQGSWRNSEKAEDVNHIAVPSFEVCHLLTPKPCCDCNTCQTARKQNNKFLWSDVETANTCRRMTMHCLPSVYYGIHEYYPAIIQNRQQGFCTSPDIYHNSQAFTITVTYIYIWGPHRSSSG
jgi:hypothetical protein